MDNKRIVIQIRLDKELKDKFQEVCEKNAINPSAKIRQLITEWLNKQQEKDIK